MTPTAHNRILGILHLVYGVIALVSMIAVTVMVVTMIGSASPGAIPAGGIALIVVAMVLGSIVLTVPAWLAGYGMIKRKLWARKVGLAAGILAAISFPVGTALCVYTLWFLFGEKGRFLYHKAAYALPEKPPMRKLGRTVKPEYVPPTAPPDWR
ncbi:MAG: hypothetical protein ABJB97_04280 [Acidobacteriota bacterium]